MAHDREQDVIPASSLLAFLGGALLGGAVGILLAPRPGKETRAQLRDYADKASKEWGETGRKVGERVREEAGRVTDEIGREAGRVGEKVGKAVNEAAERGKHYVSRRSGGEPLSGMRAEAEASEILEDV